MRTGNLSKRVVVKQTTSVLDGAGGTTPTKTELLETWANITPVRGQRAFQYNQIIQATWYDVTLRFREDTSITKDLILEYKDITLVLHSVINKDEKSRVIQAIAYEKT